MKRDLASQLSRLAKMAVGALVALGAFVGFLATMLVKRYLGNPTAHPQDGQE